MLNVVINMCEKFHYDRLRNNRALGNGKSDNNNVCSHWHPFPGLKCQKALGGFFTHTVRLLWLPVVERVSKDRGAWVVCAP